MSKNNNQKPAPDENGAYIDSTGSQEKRADLGSSDKPVSEGPDKPNAALPEAQSLEEQGLSRPEPEEQAAEPEPEEQAAEPESEEQDPEPKLEYIIAADGLGEDFSIEPYPDEQPPSRLQDKPKRKGSRKAFKVLSTILFILLILTLTVWLLLRCIHEARTKSILETIRSISCNPAVCRPAFPRVLWWSANGPRTPRSGRAMSSRTVPGTRT